MATLAMSLLTLPACSPHSIAAQVPGPAQPGDALALNGRVVDAAHILSPVAARALDAKLAAYETRTKHQLVVVTTPTLGGAAVDAYSLRLFNRWHIGRRGINDGVGVLVAPKERRVRIEVGFGLQRALPDAAAAKIIREAAIPHFRDHDLPGGIVATVDGIIGALDRAERSGSATAA